jgi:hypothetical protein
MCHVSSPLHVRTCLRISPACMQYQDQKILRLFTQISAWNQAAKAKNPIMATIKSLLAQVFKIEVRRKHKFFYIVYDTIF